MEKRIRKPIPTSIIISLVLAFIGIVLMKYEQQLSGVLCFVLGIILMTINGMLMPCGAVLFKKQVSRKELKRYSSFASFYLKDRRLPYTKATFEKAITNSWYDVVTMCLLLGIKSAYEDREKQAFLMKALHNQHLPIYEILLRGGVSGNFVVEETGDHFLFETLKHEDTKFLSFLLQRKISPDVTNVYGETPIFTAIREKRIQHLELLLDYKCDLNVQNKERLTPLFYALKEGCVECSGLIAKALQKDAPKHEISFVKLKEALLVNPLPPKAEKDLLVQLVTSQDETTLGLLKRYFTNKKDFNTQVETGVELYVRLSGVEASMEKQQIVTKQVKEMHKEEECKKELYARVLRQYRFAEKGDFQLENLYREPKCIDSYRERCEKCNGIGSVPCTYCGGSGEEKCAKCQGTGEVVCSKCKGTLKASCETIKKYIECQDCHDGNFACIKCDEEGKQPCPTCEGHGTTKCKCPSDKKMKCPHCDKGYISIKGGMYKKCAHCKDGEICLLCHNKGWVDERFKNKGYECKTCKGEKRIVCQTCKGKKKVKCAKRFEVPCDCGTGKEVCPICHGTTQVPCKKCEGTKREKCTECTDGYFYTNIYVNFSAKQFVRTETIIGERNNDSYLKELADQMGSLICNNHRYIDKVYRIFQIDMRAQDVTIRNYWMNEKVHGLIGSKNEKGILDILELAPLEYTVMTFKEKDGFTYQCVLVGGQFYKTFVK